MQYSKTIFFLFLFSFNFGAMQAQRIATLEVKVPKAQQGLSLPVQVALDGITFLPESDLQLAEVTGKKRVPVAFQVDNKGQRMLHWIVSPSQTTAAGRIFELLNAKESADFPQIKAERNNGAVTITAGNRNLLRYNFKTVYPPTGIDTAYRRSGFIHPLWSPKGQELTRINAPDHYHHWGLWNPWTHTLFEGDSVDFWNLARKQGTVRFANFLSTTNGPVFAEYKALHEHVAFKKEGGEKVALNEVQAVRVYQPSNNQDYYIADITINLSCASESPLHLLEYRYGGLGLRATADWTKDNSQVLTSEGKSRPESDGSLARWCMVQGAVAGDHAGFVMMSYPANYNHPEPLRVWPENSNGRGDVFVNFSPTKNRDWLLLPGKEYVLKYRFLVFNNQFSGTQAEAAWQNFAQQPTVIVKKHQP